LEKYGTINFFDSEKTKQTMLEKYGVTNPSLSTKTKKVKYNYDWLSNHCKNNNVKLLYDYSECDMNGKSNVEGICCNEKCNNQFIKCLRLLETNGQCKECTAVQRLKTLEENNIKKYGVKNVFEAEQFKNKIKQTNLEKYGVENPSQAMDIKNKKEKKSIEKYGTKCVFQATEVKTKIKDTNTKKYGVKNVSQNAEISEKQQKAYKFKDYILPSGNIIKYQGYENYALDVLLKSGINENDIVTSRKLVPVIWYYDKNNVKRRHFVDIFIKSQNKCIEVKSTWTLKKHYDKVFAKQSQAKEEGYNYEIYVYDDKGNMVEHHI
jgi:hypothetical protein